MQMIARVFTGILFGFLIPANMALVIESAPPAYRGRHACMHACLPLHENAARKGARHAVISVPRELEADARGPAG